MSYGQVNPQSQAQPTCYRHPQTVSYVSCNRCGRPICPQCQVPAPVGIQCVECVQQANKNIPTQKTQYGGRLRLGLPLMTTIFIALNVIVYLLQRIVPGTTQDVVLVPFIAAYEPWRLITSAFAHSPSSIFHILMNMYGVYIFGTMLEPRLGRIRFVWLYLLSAFGGSIGVLLLSPANTATLGASGALSGLFLATIIFLRGNKPAVQQLVIVLALNVVLGFLVPGISWQAHLGGAVIGGLAALCIVAIPRSNPQRSTVQFALLGALTLLLAIATYFAMSAVAWPLS